VSLPLYNCMHNDKMIMGDEFKKEEKSDLQVCMDEKNKDSQKILWLACEVRGDILQFMVELGHCLALHNKEGTVRSNFLLRRVCYHKKETTLRDDEIQLYNLHSINLELGLIANIPRVTHGIYFGDYELMVINYCNIDFSSPCNMLVAISMRTTHGNKMHVHVVHTLRIHAQELKNQVKKKERDVLFFSKIEKEQELACESVMRLVLASLDIKSGDKRLSGTMELMNEGGLKEKIIRVGKKLKHPHHSEDALLKNLEETANCLAMVEQSDKYMIQSLMFQLIKPRIFWHEDVRVKITGNHLENVMVAIQSIMSTVIDEYDNIPQHLLNVLKEELRQEASCISHTLAKSIMNQIKMKTYMAAKSSENDMGMDPQGMSSSVHTNEFSVYNICIECEGTKESDAKVKNNQESLKALSKGYPPTNKNANGKFVGPYSTAVHMQQKTANKGQPRSLLGDQTHTSKGKPRNKVMGYSKKNLANEDDEVIVDE
ncbi:hypothetical protein KI387_024040, partial [Taxus chinensis]